MTTLKICSLNNFTVYCAAVLTVVITVLYFILSIYFTALVITNTLFQQHKRRLYTWTLPDGQHRNQIDYILCSHRWRSSIQSAKTRPGADCGSDHELLIAKFRLKFKKVGKTTRPFRYELNQIPYDYTVEQAMAPLSSSLAWKIPWTEEPGGLQSMGSLRVGHD